MAGDVDLLIIETCQDLLQTKAALIAIYDEFEAHQSRLPVIVQVTMENTGTMLLGSDMQAVITTLAPFPIEVLGMNCATGPKAMGAHVRTLAASWGRFISIIPNAGLPQNIDGEMVYDLTAEELAGDLHHFVSDLGVNIVGGWGGRWARRTSIPLTFAPYWATFRQIKLLESGSLLASNGLSLGASQALLLKKIEELTLYMIAMQKANEALKERMRFMERFVEQQ